MNKPMIKDDPLYQLIREGKIKEFNKKNRKDQRVQRWRWNV